MDLHPCLSCSFKEEWHRKKFQQKDLQPLQQDLLIYLYVACSHKREGTVAYSAWLSNPSLISTFQLYNSGDERRLQLAARRLIEQGLVTGYEADRNGDLLEIIPLSARWEEKTPIQRITLTDEGVKLAQSFPQYSETPDHQAHPQGNHLLKSLSIFLKTLFGSASASKNKLVVWSPGVSRTTQLPTDDLNAAAEDILDVAAEREILLCAGLYRENQMSVSRAPTAVGCLPGFWLEVGMPNATLDASQAHTFLETVWAWAESLSLRPTLAVTCGSRLQIYWLFESPWMLNTGEERERAQALSKNFQKSLRKFTQEYYWDCPDTSSLSYFVRLPGTWQHLQDRRIPVILFKQRDERRYTPHDFEFPIEPMRHVRKTTLHEILEELRQVVNCMTNPGVSPTGSRSADSDEMDGEEFLPHESPKSVHHHSAGVPARSASTAVMETSPDSYYAPLSDSPAAQRQEEQLIRLANELELFHASNRISYAVIPMRDHIENHPIHSKTVRNYLAYTFYQRYGRTADFRLLEDTVHFLEVKEKLSGTLQEIYTRVARLGDEVYLDLANHKGEAVKITAQGWEVILNPPVRFRRSRGMLALPTPQTGGSIGLLRGYLNLASEFDFKLIVGWLLEAFRCDTPKPILALQGDNGTAKSITTRLLGSLLDPTVMGVQAPPANKVELSHSIRNSWILAYDNLSAIPKWMSDTFCRVSTGSGFLENQPEAEADEIPSHVLRPILLNGLKVNAIKSDLRDRVITITLPPLPENLRREEKELLSLFQHDAPLILGTLLDGVSSALQREKDVRLSEKPRMLDFVKWVTAAEPALGWEPESFLNAYRQNRLQKDETVLQTDTVASAVMEYIQPCSDWEGSAQELLEIITPLASVKERQARTWPDSPRSLTNRLRKLEPTLKALGIEIHFPENAVWIAREGRTKRLIRITNHHYTPAQEETLTA